MAKSIKAGSGNAITRYGIVHNSPIELTHDQKRVLKNVRILSEIQNIRCKNIEREINAFYPRIIGILTFLLLLTILLGALTASI